MLDPGILIGDSMASIEAYGKATRNVHYLFSNIERIGQTPSKCNTFYPGEHPFVKIQPYGKYNYFWGKAHLDSLTGLQDWMNTRLDQIDDILERQAYPARVGSGFMGLSEEKMAAFGGPDSFVFDQLPNAKVEELRPDMPADIFAEFDRKEKMFSEVSGITEVMSGRSETGVRSKQHAGQLNKTGAGRIKKSALGLESSLIKLGDVGLKMKQAHDPEELYTEEDEEGKKHKFFAHDVKRVKMQVDGHSHSPLFGDESRELAVIYRKFGTVDDGDFIRMTNPPGRDTLLHNLRRRQKRQAKMKRELAAQGIDPNQQGQKRASGRKR